MNKKIYKEITEKTEQKIDELLDYNNASLGVRHAGEQWLYGIYLLWESLTRDFYTEEDYRRIRDKTSLRYPGRQTP